MANQFFKSIYFKDHPSDKTKSKTFTLAFNEKEESYYNKIKDLSNIEIKDLIGIDKAVCSSITMEIDNNTIIDILESDASNMVGDISNIHNIYYFVNKFEFRNLKKYRVVLFTFL